MKIRCIEIKGSCIFLPTSDMFIHLYSHFRRKNAGDNDKLDDVNDTNERPTRSLRQRKAANNSSTIKDEKLPNERKNSAAYSPGKFRKVVDEFTVFTLNRFECISIHFFASGR